MYFITTKRIVYLCVMLLNLNLGFAQQAGPYQTKYEDLEKIDRPYFYAIEKEGARIWLLGDTLGVSFFQLPSYVFLFLDQATDIVLPYGIEDSNLEPRFISNQISVPNKITRYANINQWVGLSPNTDIINMLSVPKFFSFEKIWHQTHPQNSIENYLASYKFIEKNLEEHFYKVTQSSYLLDETKYIDEVTEILENTPVMWGDCSTEDIMSQYRQEEIDKIHQVWELNRADPSRIVFSTIGLEIFLDPCSGVKLKLEELGYKITRVDSREKAIAQYLELYRIQAKGEILMRRQINERLHSILCTPPHDTPAACAYQNPELSRAMDPYLAPIFYQNVDWKDFGQFANELLDHYQMHFMDENLNRLRNTPTTPQ